MAKGLKVISAKNASARLAAKLRAKTQAPAPESASESAGIVLDLYQQRAVTELANEQHGCLTGAAGTGKTTTVMALVEKLTAPDEDGMSCGIGSVSLSQYRDPAADFKADLVVPSIVFAAFTGQATRVLSQHIDAKWRANVMTIHSLLGYAPTEYLREDGTYGMRFEPTYTTLRKLPWQIYILDEASMIPRKLWEEIRAAAKPDARFIFIGDIHQLPPVTDKAGIFLDALQTLPSYELKTIHRQKDAAGDKIIAAATAVRSGKTPVWDSGKDKDWAVLGYKLNNDPEIAHQEICAAAYKLHAYGRYDPWKDRILTSGNGYNSENTLDLVGQSPINESLAKVFIKNPRLVISYQMDNKNFAIDDRVMATVNEPPDIPDRITNGAAGVITKIEENYAWIGDRRLVGDPEKIREETHKMLTASGAAAYRDLKLKARMPVADIKLDDGKGKRLSGEASHKVTVKFDTGAQRTYTTCAQIEQLQLCFASTVYKAQGSEMDVAIVVVHHALRRGLSREYIYTAITRAKKSVIVLYSAQGLRLATSKQMLSGNTLEDKIADLQLKRLRSGKKPARFA